MILSPFFRHPRPLAWPAILLGVAAAYAQPAPATPPPANPAPDPQTTPAPFQSALDGYQPYADERTLDWRQANELTAQIGGWRAYAREAAQTGDADPHAGHHTLPGAKP